MGLVSVGIWTGSPFLYSPLMVTTAETVQSHFRAVTARHFRANCRTMSWEQEIHWRYCFPTAVCCCCLTTWPFCKCNWEMVRMANWMLGGITNQLLQWGGKGKAYTVIMIIINRRNEYRTSCTRNHKRRYKYIQMRYKIVIIIILWSTYNKWSRNGGQVKWWGYNERRLSGDWSPDETSVVTLFSLLDAVPAALFQLLLIYLRMMVKHTHTLYSITPTRHSSCLPDDHHHSSVCGQALTVCLLLVIISDDGMDVVILVYCIIVGVVVYTNCQSECAPRVSIFLLPRSTPTTE